MLRSCALLLCCSFALLAQKYTGPQPEKSDLPYLVHADNLVATEAGEAKNENRKNEVVAVLDGPTCQAATPLASPIFLIRTDQLTPEALQIFKMESKNGKREVVLSRKNKPVARPVMTAVNRVGDNLYKIEVDQQLGNGEYVVTPSGSDRVFCFRVY